MANLQIVPPVPKEPEPAAPTRRAAAPPQPFVPAPQSRPPAQPAPAPVGSQAQRQKQRPTVQQERPPARDIPADARPNDPRSNPIDTDTEFEGTWTPSAADDRSGEFHDDRSGEFHDGKSGEAERDACREDKALAAAGAAELDMEALAEALLPSTDDDGIFEVSLPNGQKMAVAVNIKPDVVRIHLTTSDEKLGDRLRQKKMELRGHLERHIQRNVDITVL
jgi:hypothetical protein